MDSPITRAEHNEVIRRMEDEHRRISKRIDILEEANLQNQELITNVGIMATNMENMLKEQKRQGERLELLEQKPAQSFDTLKSGFYNAIGAALGGALLAVLLYFL